MFAKMVNMAHTPDEVKEELKEMGSPAVAAPSISKYPYGLCLSLDDDTLEKLGLDGDLPEVGEAIQFTAMARVTSASMNEREDTSGKIEQCKRVELQITDMGIPMVDAADQAVEKSAQRRQRFYGKPPGDSDADGE